MGKNVRAVRTDHYAVHVPEDDETPFVLKRFYGRKTRELWVKADPYVRWNVVARSKLVKWAVSQGWDQMSDLEIGREHQELVDDVIRHSLAMRRWHSRNG